MRKINCYILLIIITTTLAFTKTDAQNIIITLGYNYDSTTNISKVEYQEEDTTIIDNETNLQANQLFELSDKKNVKENIRNQTYPLFELSRFYLINKLFPNTKTQYTYVLFIVLVNYLIT